MKENLKSLFSGCLTVPNLLSLIRILLIPVFGVLFSAIFLHEQFVSLKNLLALLLVSAGVCLVNTGTHRT